jgi:hypothetical protein
VPFLGLFLSRSSRGNDAEIFAKDREDHRNDMAIQMPDQDAALFALSIGPDIEAMSVEEDRDTCLKVYAVLFDVIETLALIPFEIWHAGPLSRSYSISHRHFSYRKTRGAFRECRP